MLSQQHIQEFTRFYEGLSNHKDIFYICFCSKLLHYAKKSVSLIPENINLVLICQNMSDGEKQYIEQHFHRPVFYIDNIVDDNDVWYMLLQCNSNNFGWIDVDCFILKTDLLDELSRIDSKDALRGLWKFKDNNQKLYPLLHSFCLYINLDVYRYLLQKYPDMQPYVYIGVHQKEPITKTELRYLSPQFQMLADQFFFRQACPPFEFLDTLQLYQILSLENGFQLVRCREKTGVNDALHIGASYYCVKYILTGENPLNFRPNFLQFTTMYMYLLCNVPDLPEDYYILKQKAAKKLSSFGIDENMIPKLMMSKFMEMGVKKENIHLYLN